MVVLCRMTPQPVPIPAPRVKSRPVNTGEYVHVVGKALSVVPAPGGSQGMYSIKACEHGASVHVVSTVLIFNCEQGGICTCGNFSF